MIEPQRISLTLILLSVITVEDINIIPVPEQMFTGEKSDELSEICLNEDIIYKKLCSININKSPGSDDLHPIMLYELRDQLVKPLTKVFRRSIETSIVPEEWRDARVSPLFKKGRRDKPEN